MFARYILKTFWDKFVIVQFVINIKVLKTDNLQALYSILSTKIYIIEAGKHLDAHRQYDYKNHALSIMGPAKVLTVIDDKMDHANKSHAQFIQSTCNCDNLT